MEGKMVQFLYARKTLTRVANGDNPELALVAKTILEDPKLFVKYVARRKERLISKDLKASA